MGLQSFQSRMTVIRSFFSVLLLLSSIVAQGLECRDMGTLMKEFFKMHFSINAPNDEFNDRVLNNFIKSWDPGKTFFLEADVQDFKKKYSKNLVESVVKENKCSFIKDISSTYSKRFLDRSKKFAKVIDTNFDFKKDEYLELDRKKLNWAKNVEELDERWRKRIKFQTKGLVDSLKDIKKVRKKLHKRYFLLTKRHNEITFDQIHSRFLNSFAEAMDPHTTYFSAEETEEFRIQTSLSLDGIGAVLRSEDGFTYISSIVPGGAAFRNGKVKVDDKIIAVAQAEGAPEDVIDMDLKDVVKLIRGKRGTTVKLTILRENNGKSENLVIPIVRDKVELKDREAVSKVIEVKGQDKVLSVGVLSLPSFYRDFKGEKFGVPNFKSSSADMERELVKLKKSKIDALIVDLRGNGGGSLTEAIDVSGLFIKTGPVVQVKGADPDVQVLADENPKVVYDGPLVVLISKQSASASEIFAGAIKDYKRGILVGDSSTFGKGTVQNFHDLPRLGAIKITLSKFYRPSGSSTQLKGVDADIVLPSMLDVAEFGEKYYDYALPWESVKANSFKSKDLVGQYKSKIEKLSKERVAGESFKEIREAISDYNKNKDKRTLISLSDKEDEKSKKDEKSEEDDDGKKTGVDAAINVVSDVYLQEAVNIAADYSALLAGKDPTIWKISEVEKSKQKEKMANAKKAKK